jgi:peptidoglycan/xylan/chitin deacetylase (PgdA/CDA1 family)
MASLHAIFQSPSGGPDGAVPLNRPRTRTVVGWTALAGIALLVAAAVALRPPAAPEATLEPATPGPTTSATPTLTPSPTATPTLTPPPTPTRTATPPPAAARLPIIEYHQSTYRMSDEIMMTTEWFRDQMRWLSDNGYHTLTAAELVRFLDGGAVPAPAAVITFDIGTPQEENYTQVVIPALREYHLHAIVFVVTSMIADSCGTNNQVCWQELRQWSEEGLISVESHSVNHPHYAAISAEDQRWNAQTSKTVIETNIGRPVEGFAFPYDEFNDGALQVIQAAGYQFAVDGNTRGDRAVQLSDLDRFHLPRVYPYSNPKIYPRMYAAPDLTFGQLVQENSAVLNATPPPPTPTAAGVSPTPALSTELWKFYAGCQKADDELNAIQRLYLLDQLAFPSDISAGAQARLELPVVIRPSCNVMLGNQPRAIVLHATRGELDPSLNEFQRPSNTSVHYVIDRDGRIYQMVPEGLAAFHVSCGGKRSQCISSCPICAGPDQTFREPYLQSVGIEMVNLGQIVDPTRFSGLLYEDFLMAFGFRYWEDYPDKQLQALRILVEDIRQRYGIPYTMVMGHYRINEKTDPGPALNLFWYREGDPPREPIFADAEF